jgi:hypothetical protein
VLVATGRVTASFVLLLGMLVWMLLRAQGAMLLRPFRMPLLNALEVCSTWLDVASYLLVVLSHCLEAQAQVRSSQPRGLWMRLALRACTALLVLLLLAKRWKPESHWHWPAARHSLLISMPLLTRACFAPAANPDHPHDAVLCDAVHPAVCLRVRAVSGRGVQRQQKAAEIAGVQAVQVVTAASSAGASNEPGHVCAGNVGNP